MSDADIKAFVARFMPAYEAYLPALYRDGPPSTAAAGGKVPPTLAIKLDESRSPLTEP